MAADAADDALNYNVTSFEATSVRFPNSGAEATPGPGSYDPFDDLAADKKRWINTSTMSRGARAPAPDGADNPGPAAYEQGTTLGHCAIPTIEKSSRILFGNAARFGRPAAECRVHAYQELAAFNTPTPGSPTNCTFAPRHEVYRVDDTPGPKYDIGGGLADAAELLPRSAFMGSGSQRFPDGRSKSPGPIYGAATTLTKGTKMPPKARNGFFHDLITRHKERNSPAVRLRQQVARAAVYERSESPTQRTVVLKSGGGARVITADGLLEDEVKIDRSSGANLALCSFGQKTQRDTAVGGGRGGPGPQDYNVTDNMVKKAPPGYTFGTTKRMNAGIEPAAFEGKEQKKKRKEEDARVQQAMAKGRFMVGGEVSSGGPAFSISEPLKQRIKQSPGPGAYLVEAYDPKRKPKTATFGKSSRFGGPGAAAESVNLKREREETPGPGYYSVPGVAGRQDVHFGTSTTCPDVIGWMKQKREIQLKNHREFQEEHRKMVIMGTENREALNNLIHTENSVVIPRPKGTKRQIWR